MQKRKKQLLGIVGLVLVAALTVIASMKPVPGVEAAESQVNITAKVDYGEPGTDEPGGEPDTQRAWGQITNPESGLTTMLSTQRMTFKAKNVSYVTPCVTCTTASQTTNTVVLDAVAANAGGSIAEYSVDVAVEEIAGGDATCVFAIYNGQVTQSQVASLTTARQLDAVEVKYRAAQLQMQGTNAQGNPLAEITANNTVGSLLVQAYDRNNNPVFVNADGAEEPVLVSDSELRQGQDGLWYYDLTVPMTKYNATAGTYTLLVIAYGKDGTKIVSTNTAEFQYDPTAPEVPGTGSWIGTIFGNINIAQTDYVITGLIAFMITIVVAVAMMLKRSRR